MFGCLYKTEWAAHEMCLFFTCHESIVCVEVEINLPAQSIKEVFPQKILTVENNPPVLAFRFFLMQTNHDWLQYVFFIHTAKHTRPFSIEISTTKQCFEKKNRLFLGRPKIYSSHSLHELQKCFSFLHPIVEKMSKRIKQRQISPQPIEKKIVLCWKEEGV